jgi:hypothetical protein
MPARLFLRVPLADGEVIWVYIRRSIRTGLVFCVSDTLKVASQIQSASDSSVGHDNGQSLRCAIQFENLEF